MRRYGVAVEKLRSKGGFGARVRNGGSIISPGGMGRAEQEYGRSGAGTWAERRRGMGGAAQKARPNCGGTMMAATKKTPCSRVEHGVFKR